MATPIQRAVILAGPTASGKSAAALALARAWPVTVINADALQVYRDLSVLTARPRAEEVGDVPHRLYGVLDAADACAAGRWRDMALAEIAAAHDAGRLPVLVGGTGLYIKALIEGIAPTPQVPADVRDSVRARLQKEGAPALHAELAQRDPAMAAQLAPGDRQRVARALEVVLATGRSLRDFQQVTAPPIGLDFITLVLLPPAESARPVIVERCQRMIDMGALVEVRELHERKLDPSLPIMKAVGVRELGAHLAGDCDLETATDRFVIATRQYAKRQRTWFRHQLSAARRWDEQFSTRLEVEICSFVRSTVDPPRRSR
jgi:tRNA dimethylallyltransferase